MALKLRRTQIPEALCHNGRPLCSYWFEYGGHFWGVEKSVWNHGVLWEVFEADSVTVVCDDYQTLREVRAEAEGDCEGFLRDMAHEDALTSGYN